MKKCRLIVFISFISFMLNTQGSETVGSFAKFSATSGNVAGFLNANDHFGKNLVNIGNLNSDGMEDLAVI